MLSLMEFTSGLYATSLERVAIIGAQHILESTLHLFKFLKKHGLDPKKAFLLGKCYSSAKCVYDDLLKEGVNVSDKSFHFDSHEAFDIYYKANIKEFVKSSLEKIDFDKIDKLIVLDDGGHLISEINSLNFTKKPIVCIEQTSSGIHHLNSHNLNSYVLNVARSQAKLELETPFIIDSSIQRLLHHKDHEELNNHDILILGKGVIGQGMEKALSKQNYRVESYDPNFDKNTNLAELLKHKDLIIGCSGFTSLPFSHYEFLSQGTTLVSVSSSDREFEAHKFRRLLPVSMNCHDKFELNGITLLQGGHPVNFWGSRNNIDLHKIQLTMSLLMSAIFQATEMKADGKGLLNIDSHSEQLLIEKFQELMVEKYSLHLNPKVHKFPHISNRIPLCSIAKPLNSSSKRLS